MREIKFRGFSKEDEKWVYGFYVFDEFKDANGRAGIAVVDTPFGFELTTVHPKSIGQYTGLKDKNGKEIYEGDIVRGRIYHMHAEDNVIFQIRWTDQEKGYGMHWYPSEIEVIGNIYENPKLIDR